jgi:hypothetical protein
MKLNRRSVLLAGAASLVAARADAAGSFLLAAPKPAQLAWSTLKVGAGGWVTGLQIAADGTKVIRTDTFGAYTWNGSQWVQLCTSLSLPSGTFGPDPSTGNWSSSTGVYEIALAPSSTSIFYMIYQGLMFKSTTKGVSWKQLTGWTAITNAANDSFRQFGRKMAVDPQNPSIVLASGPSTGVFISTNGGTTWSHISAIPSATGGQGHAIAFDPSSSVVGGVTQGIYVSSYGNGVYRSTNGGTTWTLTSSGPTTHQHMLCTSAGVLWLTTNGGTQALWRFTGSWANVNAGGQGSRCTSIAVNGSNIYIGIDSGDVIVSTNGGSTWTDPNFNNTRVATDIPWLANTKEVYMSNGDMAWDTTTSRLYFAEGIGVWQSASPGATMTWTSQSLGIEQLVATSVRSIPGAAGPLLTCGDRPVFYLTNMANYPSDHGPNHTYAIVYGSMADYAPSSPNIVVGIFNGEGATTDQSGISTNYGATWSLYGTYPPLASNGKLGGSICTKDGTTIVWFPSQNGQPYVSVNGGGSWSPITMSGVSPTGETGWGYNMFLFRRILCVDAAGTFYAYNYGGASKAGVYSSTDGVNWTRVHTGRLNIYDGFNAKLKAVPGVANNLFFTGGNVGGSISGSLYRSTDGGANWTAVANVLEAQDVGFGKIPTGGSYPAIFFAGWYNNVYGVWTSTDNAATFTNIGTFPTNWVDQVSCIEGDMNNEGWCYIGFAGGSYGSGSGFVYYHN